MVKYQFLFHSVDQPEHARPANAFAGGRASTRAEPSTFEHPCKCKSVTLGSDPRSAIREHPRRGGDRAGPACSGLTCQVVVLVPVLEVANARSRRSGNA